MSVGNPDDIHRRIESLLGAYALDAVEPEEAELVARHLPTCPRCRAEVAEHREVAGMLGYVGQQAPMGVWERIAASLEEAPPALALEPLPRSMAPANRHGRRRARTRAVVAAAAAVAAAVIAVLGVEVSRLSNRTSALDRQLAAPNMAAVHAALTVPDSRHVVLRGAGGRPLLDAVIEPNGSGYLYASNLPRLGADRTYQLWGVVDGNQISYGTLGAEPKVESFRASSGVRALAVTDEIAGGVVRTTQTPVAVGALRNT